MGRILLKIRRFCSILERVTFNILYLCTASGKTHSVTVLFRISICSRVFLIILVLNPLSQKDVGSMLMGAPGLIQLSVLDNDISGSIWLSFFDQILVHVVDPNFNTILT